MLRGKKNYVFIDEMQLIQDFQRAADGLFIGKGGLTGSNSRVQSGEWATLIACIIADEGLLQMYLEFLINFEVSYEPNN